MGRTKEIPIIGKIDFIKNWCTLKEKKKK
jgi:hypothetical protein